MGLKKLKEYYCIDRHDVIREGEKVFIGTGYVHNLITITDEGRTVVRNPTFAGSGGFLDELAAKMKVDAERGVLSKIINASDVFKQILNVWTYDGGRVILKECEEYGWPNTTTDGQMMYDNTFFLTRAEALKACRRNDRGFILNLETRRQNVWRDLKDLVKYHAKAFWQIIRSHVFRGI